MDKNTKNSLIGIILMLVAISGLIYWGMQQPEEQEAPSWLAENAPIDRQAEIVFFYGRECPHCLDTEKFIEENKIYEKVAFQALEVWHNQKNNEYLIEKAEECDLAEDELAVPFLWSAEGCLIGSPDIENFFRQKAGI